MIIVKLTGGLGNQLFQYALGRKLSLLNNTELCLDISHYENDPKRTYELGPFAIKARIISTAEIAQVKPTIIKEKYFHVDETILQAKDNSYLDGYWQSEKYWSDIGPTLRNELKLAKGLPSSMNEYLKLIESTESVGLHVRRGDYVTEKKTNTFHGTCSSAYYAEAVELIASKLTNPFLFIFSDDIEWVKKNLSFTLPTTYVSRKDFSATDELILTSKACHFIIANSSFSWWAAWLSANQNKLIIGPKRWFADEKIDVSGILPSSWIKI